MAVSLAAIVGYASLSILTSNADEGAFDRYSDIAPGQAVGTAYEYRRDTIALVPEYIRDYPLGAGIGSKGPAGSRVGRSTVGGSLNAESELTFLIIEVGLPGLLVMLGLHMTLVGRAMRRIRRLANAESRLLLAGVAAPLVALLATWIVGVSTATTPSSPYFWFSAGILSYWLWTKRQEDQQDTGPPGTLLFEPTPGPDRSPGSPAAPPPQLQPEPVTAAQEQPAERTGLLGSFQREMRRLRRLARQRAASDPG
jgi:hypothetical protein